MTPVLHPGMCIRFLLLFADPVRESCMVFVFLDATCYVSRSMARKSLNAVDLKHVMMIDCNSIGGISNDV